MRPYISPESLDRGSTGPYSFDRRQMMFCKLVPFAGRGLDFTMPPHKNL
jgi:hypothetical protein